MASREIIALDCGVAQSLHRIPTFGDRLSCLLDGAVQPLFRLHRALWQQLRNSLEPQQQTMEALKQSVVKVPRDACALADTRLQRHGELMMQLPDTQLVGCPQQRQKQQPRRAARNQFVW